MKEGYLKETLLFFFTICLSFIGVAQTGNTTNWQDTLNKYLKTHPQVSIDALTKALSAAEVDDTLSIDMMVAMVNDYAQLRKSDSARAISLKAYQLAEKINDKRRMARTSLSKAWTARDFGLSEEVLENALNANKLARQLSDTVLMIMSANTLASVYYDVKNDSLQKEYLLLSISLAKQSNQENEALNAMSNLGYIYLKEKNYADAERLLLKVIDITEAFPVRNYSALYMTYGHLIDLYEEQQEYQKCIDYTDTLIHITSISNWEDYILMHKALRPFYRSKMGETSLRNPFLKQFTQVDVSAMTVDQKKVFVWNKARINAEFKNYKDAYQYQNMFQQISDSLNQVDLRDQIAFYKEKFDAGEREQKILNLENENTIARLTAEKRKNQLFLLGAIVIVVIGFASILGLLFKRLKKAKLELEELNRVKDKFFAIVSHDLRNSISAFQGVGRIIDSHVKKERWDRLVQLGGKMDNEASKLNSFLNNLLNWSIAQLERTPYHPQSISLKAKLDETVALLETQLTTKNIRLEINVPDQQHVYADNDALSLILRNLFSNAIKFSEEDGAISISTVQNNNKIEVSIQDEGVGMNESKVNDLFSPSTKTSEKGTKGEEGSGLGLVLVKEFLKVNKGEIFVRSKPGKGTTFSFTLPVH